MIMCIQKWSQSQYVPKQVKLAMAMNCEDDIY